MGYLQRKHRYYYCLPFQWGSTLKGRIFPLRVDSRSKSFLIPRNKQQFLPVNIIFQKEAWGVYIRINSVVEFANSVDPDEVGRNIWIYSLNSQYGLDEIFFEILQR